jgi:hypothetical protein
VRRADEQEFHESVSARLDRWRRSAFLMCQNWHTADDIVSVAIGRLYEHWPGRGRRTTSTPMRSDSSLGRG